MRTTRSVYIVAAAVIVASGLACRHATKPVSPTSQPMAPTSQPRSPEGRRYLSQPLVTEIYTADPSAHVFGGRIYIYASHDISEGPSLPDVEPFKGSKGNA